MTKTCPIYIPSIGRARPDLQHTLTELKELAPDWCGEARLVVPPDEAEEYGRCAERLGYNAAIVMPCPEHGIGAVRQWLVDQTKTFMIMIDDDMKFYKRDDPDDEDDLDLVDMVPGDLDTMLSKMLTYMMGPLTADSLPGQRYESPCEPPPTFFGHVSVAARFLIPGYAKRGCGYYDIGARANNIHGLDCRLLRRNDIKYTALPVMEDFYVTLSLMHRGYPNLVITEYAWNQRGSGKEGGCSTYRTGEMQEQAAVKLGELFPGVVKVVDKKSGTAGQWIGLESRKDVNIQWKKALPT